MGYRSDMALALTKFADPFFQEACRTIAATPTAAFKNPLFEDAEERIESEDQILYIWKSIKAYDIAMIRERFLEKLEERLMLLQESDPLYNTDTEDHYHLIRLGEDPGDLDDFGDLGDDWSLGWTRELTIDRESWI